MLKKICLGLAIFLSISVEADVEDCKNLFVGRIEFYRAAGVHRITLVNQQSDKNGSQWVSLNGWEESQKNQMLSVLLAAKLSGSKVYVETSGLNSGSCNIKTDTDRVLERVILQQGDY